MNVTQASCESMPAPAPAPAPVVAVYLCGHKYSTMQVLWYRVELPITTNDHDPMSSLLGKRKRIIPSVSRVAEMHTDEYGHGGSWTVIDNDIYWIGGFLNPMYEPPSVTKYLLKHNMNNSNPASWEKISSSRNILLVNPFIAALIGEKTKQLCVVSGFDPYCGDWKQCGEIYNFKEKTWKVIDNVNYNDVKSYNTLIEIVQDVDKPTEIVFYSLARGSMMVLDVNDGGCIKGPVYPADFNNVSMLQELRSYDVPVVLADSTFYWCTNVYYLYAYDTKSERWFPSTSLKEYFPPIDFEKDDPHYPLLLGLGNGKFVLVSAVHRGYSTMALFTVDKTENSLVVSVDHLQHLYFGDDVFFSHYGQAMLKNTGSGSMHKCV